MKKFSGRLDDYCFDCQQCGQRYWYSETTQLDVYTGKGGLRVCPKCKDSIDYGLVPYTIPSQAPIPMAGDSIHTGQPSAVYMKHPPLDTSVVDPIDGGGAT